MNAQREHCRGLFFGAGKAVLDLVRDQGALGLIQQLARRAGMKTGPGAGEYTEGQYNNLYAYSTAIPGMPDVLMKAFLSKGGLEGILRVDTKANLPAGTQEMLDKLEKQILGTQGGAWTAAEIAYTNSQIQDVGSKIVTLETELKKLLGPTGAIVVAIAGAGAMGATIPGLAITGTAVAGAGALAVGQRVAGEHKKIADARKEGVKPKWYEMGMMGVDPMGAPGVVAAAMEERRQQFRKQRPEDNPTWISPQEYAAFAERIVQNIDSLRFSVDRLTDSMEKNTDETARNTLDRPQIVQGISGNKVGAP